MQYQIDHTDLSLVLALVRGRSLARAAELLQVDVSTVFRAVRRLEAALGVALFEKSRRGYEPSETARALAEQAGLPLHIFRLAGIYGPGRGPFEKVRNGTARRIIKPGQVFSRIHGEDIAQVLQASLDRPAPGTAYNVCDDDPAPPQDVLAHAAALLGLPPPPEVPFDEAAMTPMARSFYADNKRVSNRRIKEDLGVRLRYPDYRSGLAAILAAEGGSPHGLRAASVHDPRHE